MQDQAQVTGARSDTTAPSDHFLTINGRRHHYLEWGSSRQRLLMLLHGGNSSARGTWTRTAPAFLQNYHIIAADHRGHGETEWDPEMAYTIANYVADFEQVVEHLGSTGASFGGWFGGSSGAASVGATDRASVGSSDRASVGSSGGASGGGSFDLVGHSLGGMIALTYASRHPDHVRRLVLVDSGPRTFAAADAARMGMPERPMTFATREAAEAFARASFPEAARDRSVSYGFIQRPDGAWTWRADVAGLQRARRGEDSLRAGGLWSEFAAIRCPILILRGGRSFALSDETARQIEAANPHVRIITYPEAHHWVHDDEPERFATDVAAFLDSRG